MLRNAPNQRISVFAFDYTTGAPKTGDAGNLTAYVSKDDGSVTVLTDTSATEKDATNARGWYDFDLAQAETNAVKLLFSGKSSTANVAVVGQCIYTLPDLGAMKTVIDKLDTMLQVAGGSPTDYAFSNDALRNVPLLALAEIADAIWNRAVAGHTTAGSFGLALALAQEFAARLATTIESASGSPNEWRFSRDALRHMPSLVWDAERAMYVVAGSFGAAIDTNIGSRASASTLSAIGSLITVVKVTTDKLETMLRPAPAGSPADYAFSADAFRFFEHDLQWDTAKGAAVLSAAASVLINLDTTISSRASASALTTVGTNVAASLVILGRLNTLIEPTSGSPGDYQFTADSLRNAPTGPGGGGGGAPSAGDNADAVWDEATSGHVAAGTFGRLVFDVRAYAAKLDSLLEASGSPLAFRFTDEALTKTADVVLNAQRANYQTGGSVGEAIFQTDIRGRRTVIRGTVGNATTPTVTQFTPSAQSVACASLDQLKGRIILFDLDTLTPGLRGEATRITNSSNAALPLLTFETLSVAATDGDTYSIV